MDEQIRKGYKLLHDANGELGKDYKGGVGERELIDFYLSKILVAMLAADNRYDKRKGSK